MSKDSKKNFCSFLSVGSSGYTAFVIRVQIDVRAWQSKHPGSLQQTAAVFLFLFFFLRANTHSHTNTHWSSSVSVTKDGHGCKGSNKSKDKNGPPSSFVSLNSWMLNLWAAVCSLPLSGSLLLYRHPPVELPHRRMGSH